MIALAAAMVVACTWSIRDAGWHPSNVLWCAVFAGMSFVRHTTGAY